MQFFLYFSRFHYDLWVLNLLCPLSSLVVQNIIGKALQMSERLNLAKRGNYMYKIVNVKGKKMHYSEFERNFY